MLLNYVLLVVSGGLSVFGIVTRARGGFAEVPFMATLAAIVVFILVLIATLLGIDYLAFKMMIEQLFARA